MRARFLALVTATSLASVSAAHADASKAWSAAKANLPSDATIVAGFNFASIAKSKMFAEVFPKLIASSPELKEFLDLAKSQCSIDPLTAVGGAVLALDATKSNGVVYLALNNLDQPKIASCVEKLAKAKGKADEKITFKKDGNTIEVMSSKDNKPHYYGWVGNDVIVISKDADKTGLAHWMGGKGFSGSGVGKVTGKVNTGASVWAATTEGKGLPTGGSMKGGYGTVDLAGGKVTIGAHITMGSPTEAGNTVTEVNKQLAAAKTSGGLPPPLPTLLAGLKVSAAGDEMVLAATETEDDVLAFAKLAMAMSGMGSGGASTTAPPPPAHTTSPGLGGAKP
jgi:hypothetical protein